MEFKQLESYAAVVRCASFTKAAEDLYISQPTISTHVRALEDELGQRLIMRTTKSIEVTAEGRRLYEYAVNLLELRDRMLRECSAGAKSIIHLGASTIPSAYILPELLPKFGTLKPSAFFVIHQSDSKAVVDGLMDGLFDVGLVGMPTERESLVCESFCRDRMVIITPVTEHFLKLRAMEEPPLTELFKEPVILREKGSGTKKSADVFLERMGLTDDKLNISARINDPEAIKNLVAGGLGISIISERAARNFLLEKRLLKFELPDDANTRDLFIVYRRDQGQRTDIREFVDFVRRFYSGGR